MNVRFLSLVACLALLFAVTPLRANIYMKVEGPSQFSVTNTPKGEGYVQVVETSRERENAAEPDEVKKAVELAEGRYRIPESLIFSILRSYEGKDGALMPLPPGYVVEHGDTVLRDAQENILVSTKYFQDMLKRYNGNMTLTLAAYYAGPEKVDKVGGVPNDSQVKRFVRKVQTAFDKFEHRSAVIYTYRDKKGVLNVVNIR